MLKRALNHALPFLLGGSLVLLDQYTKVLVRAAVPLNGTWSPWPWLLPYARILHIENTGAAFGMFKNAGLFFMIVGIIVSLVIIVYSLRLPPGHTWMRIALGMQLGGALGNLIDRILFGPVTDFISLGNFAIFNVADASISVGTALLALLMLVEARAERRQADTGSTLPPVDVGEAS